MPTINLKMIPNCVQYHTHVYDTDNHNFNLDSDAHFWPPWTVRKYPEVSKVKNENIASEEVESQLELYLLG